MLLGIVATPIVRISGPNQPPGVESERCGVRRARVGLYDVPSEDAENDAVAGPRTDPPHGADGASGSDVWQRALDIVADEPRGFAVHAAIVLVVLINPLFCHLQTIATSGGEVERRCSHGPLAAFVGRPAKVTRAWHRPMSRSADARPITNEPHDRRAGVVRQPWG